MSPCPRTSGSLAASEPSQVPVRPIRKTSRIPQQGLTVFAHVVLRNFLTAGAGRADTARLGIVKRGSACKPPKSLIRPEFFGQIPLLPHQLTEDVTPGEDVIVLCHLGVPRIDAPANWEFGNRWARFTSDPVTFCKTYGDFPLASPYRKHPSMRGKPSYTAGAKAPHTWNVRFGVVCGSADILAACGVRGPKPGILWSHGADLRRVRGGRRWRNTQRTYRFRAFRL